jgi:hypothetical protein
VRETISMPSANPAPASHFSVEPNDFFCMPFEQVRRVVHVDELPRILAGKNADSAVEPSEFPFSASALPRLTPDTWPRGYSSGNVALEYDWESLIGGCRFYWLGADVRGTERCRILVTRERYGEEFAEYAPERLGGPWRIESSGAHSWNSRFGLEFFLDAPLPTSLVTRVICVDHDVKWCDAAALRCSDLGRGARTAGARLLATLIDGWLAPEGAEIVMNRGDLQSWLPALLRQLSRFPASGTLQSGTSEGRAVARSAVAAFARRDLSRVSQFARQFASPQDMADEVSRMVVGARDEHRHRYGTA